MQDKKNLDELLGQAVVVLDRQYLLIENLILTSSSVLKECEHAVAEGKQNLNNVLSIYNYVLSLIDHLVRYQKIAHMIPRLNKKEQSYRALDDAMGKLKDDIRHTIQHIDKEVDNDYTGPLFGAVCWVSGSQQFIVSFNDIGRKRSSPSIVIDTHEKKFVHEFCFIYNHKYYDLEKAIAGIRVFNSYINEVIKLEIGGQSYDATKNFLIAAADYSELIAPTTHDVGKK